MPRGDGTGPRGKGPMTGRGMGKGTGRGKGCKRRIRARMKRCRLKTAPSVGSKFGMPQK